jgi:hypothetical protein
MALDELHARRLATVVTLFASALDRMELALRELESNEAVGDSPRLTSEEIQQIRQRMGGARGRLDAALKRFTVSRQKPEPRQRLAAELSALSVILENAEPQRMKGYGREFDREDQAGWESLIQALSHDVEQMRSAILRGEIEES